MANPIEDTFIFVLDRAEQWYDALCHPRRVAYELVASAGTARERTRTITRLWFSSVFLSAVAMLPVTYDYGLKLENLSFQIYALLLEYATTLLAVWCIHRSLRWYGINSRMSDTFACYTATVVGVLPILTLVALPGIARLLQVLHNTKHKLLPTPAALDDALSQLAAPTSDIILITAAFILPIVISVGFIFLAVFTELLAVVYEVQPWRVLRAVSFALAVLWPFVTIILNIAGILTFYAFIT